MPRRADVQRGGAVIRATLGRRVVLAAGAALCLGSSAGAVQRVNVRYTEINPELEGKVVGSYPPATVARTVYLSWYAGVRGVLDGVNSDESNRWGRWYYVHMARVAFYAFANGLILDPPAQYAPVDYHIFHADCCVNDTLGKCGDVFSMAVMTKVLRGGGARPPVVGLVGGSAETPAVAQLASSHGVPDVGFQAVGSPLSDKGAYPFFLRTAGDNAALWAAAIAVARSLKFTKVTVWHSPAADGVDAKALVAAQGAKLGMRVSDVLVPTGEHTGLPPLSGSRAEAAWLAMIDRALASDSRCHFSAMTPDAPVYDVMHWLALHALTGPSYFWLGVRPGFDLYHTQYVPVIQYLYPTVAGIDSPYGKLAPFEGFTSIVPSYLGPLFNSKFKPFWQSLSNETLRNQVFEPFMRIYPPDTDIFQQDGLPYLAQPASSFAFDAVWAVLLASNRLALKQGRSFTPQQLWAEVLKSDFEGISGRVRFQPETGDRILPFTVRNYNRCAARGLPVPVLPAAAAAGRRLRVRRRRLDPEEADEAAEGAGPWDSAHERSLRECMADPDCIFRLLALGAQAGPGGAAGGAAAAAGNASGNGTANATDTTGNATGDPASPASTWPTYAGFPGPGVDLEVGAVAGGNLTLSGVLVFYGCTTSPPPDQDLPCAPGAAYTRAVAGCVTCPAGTASTGQTACSACAPGTFAKSAGSSKCADCGPGTFVNTTGATKCTACPAGTAQKWARSSRCTNCTVGRTASGTSSTECQRCPVGTFAGPDNKTQCVECRGGRTTARNGSTTKDECRCGAGSYSETADGDCQNCKSGMSCPFDAAVWHWVGRGAGGSGVTGPYPTLVPGYWSDPDNIVEVWACGSTDRCPGGDPGTCGPELSGRSCALCSPGRVWDGQRCAECTAAEQSRWIFPGIPLALMPLALLLLYRISAGGVASWGGWLHNCACLLFVLLNHLQLLSLLGTPDATFPKEVDYSMRIWRITNDATTPFKIPCQGFRGFSAVMVIRVLLPVFLAAWCAIIYAASVLMRAVTPKARKECWRIEPNRLFDAYMTVLFTLSSAVAYLSLALFKCRDNPNGRQTLLEDASVVCSESGEWMQLLGVEIAALAVYCLGCGSLCAHVVASALQRFSEGAFRVRWRFLFIRYRPDAWWFGLAFLAKNFFFNCALVFFSRPVAQLYFMMAVLALYTGLVAIFRPYRVQLASTLDLTVGTLLIFIGTMLTNLLGSGERQYELSVVAVVLSWIPICSCALWLAWLTYYGLGFTRHGLGMRANPANVARNEHRAVNRLATRLREVAFILVRLQDERFTRFFFQQIGEADRDVFWRVTAMVELELKGSAKVGCGSTRLLVGQAKRDSSTNGGGSEAAAIELVHQGTSCALRTPVCGEVIALTAGPTMRAPDHEGKKDGWVLAKNQPALVLEVNDDGEVRLQNPAGCVSSFIDRAPFVYWGTTLAAALAEATPLLKPMQGDGIVHLNSGRIPSRGSSAQPANVVEAEEEEELN